MGSKISSEKKSESKPKEKELNESKGVSFFDMNNTSSSYRGIKSELSSTSGDNNNNKSNGMIASQKEKKEDYDALSYKVKVNLVWKDGGHAVYVTGSFSNWNQWFLMSKCHTNDHEFSITLELPKGVYQFKFIVDSVWKCSKDYTQQNDGFGNVNNILDTTGIINYVLEKKSAEPPGEDTVKENKSKYDKISIKDDFGESIPKKNDLNLDAPFIPFNYVKPFNIETQSKQNQIGVEEYLKNITTFLACENNSYKTVASPPHVNLNLIYTNIKANKRDIVLNVCSTVRVRNKFVTFIYYKPI